MIISETNYSSLFFTVDTITGVTSAYNPPHDTTYGPTVSTGNFILPDPNSIDGLYKGSTYWVYLTGDNVIRTIDNGGNPTYTISAPNSSVHHYAILRPGQSLYSALTMVTAWRAPGNDFQRNTNGQQLRDPITNQILYTNEAYIGACESIFKTDFTAVTANTTNKNLYTRNVSRLFSSKYYFTPVGYLPTQNSSVIILSADHVEYMY